MGILDKLAWPFKKLGQGFKWLFRYYSEDALYLIEDIAAGIILDLMAGDKPGSEKFEEALKRLKVRVVKDGFKVYNHVLQRILEKRVTQSHGDDLEAIIDDGLHLAIEAVKAVDATDLVGDSVRRDAAVRVLSQKVKEAGRTWLDVPHILHVLIQYAVSSVRAGEE